MMSENVRRESGVYGAEWNTVHDGYFSDPAIAAPLIEQVQQAISASKPDVIVDLGGGTGFLLRELICNHIDSGIDLVNLDISPKQLEMVSEKRIRTLGGSLTDFFRTNACDPGKRFLFMMRSVLHYYGKDGLNSVLIHLRSQMHEGEMFVHQTACFKEQRDADCVNLLYERMQTGKGYPTTDQLVQALEEAGWRVGSISPAPALPLTSHDLGRRYAISPDQLNHIRGEISERFGGIDVFRKTADGFCASLHYRIFVCIA